MITGIDVSDFQGEPNFHAVKAGGYDFVFTKATEGTTFLAHTFSRNWHAIKEAGLLRGAYHFAKPLTSSGGAQADWFVKMVEKQGYGAGDFPLVLDLEDEDAHKKMTGQQMAAWVGDFVTRVEQLTGRKPIIYTGAYFYNGPAYGCKLWIPSYYDDIRAPWNGKTPKLPPAWSSFVFWQHSSAGKVPGVTGRCDINVYPGSLDSLNKLAAVPKPVGPTLAQRLKKAGLGVKSITTILKKLGRNK